jgi:hypothetical protein
MGFLGILQEIQDITATFVKQTADYFRNHGRRIE